MYGNSGKRFKKINTAGILNIIPLHEKFLQFDWLSVVVNSVKFEMPTWENYKPFAGSSINK